MERNKPKPQLMTTITIHSTGPDLFETWQVCGNKARWIKGKRCGEWIIPSETLKRKLWIF